MQRRARSAGIGRGWLGRQKLKNQAQEASS
jgi:hypothetical protein